MKANCLTRALDQWNENREEYRLSYNNDHVVSLKDGYKVSNLRYPFFAEYLKLEDYGLEHFKSSFSLTPKYIKLLTEYLEYE